MSTVPNKNLLKMDAAALAIMIGMAETAYFVQISPAHSQYEQAAAETAQLAEQQGKLRELQRSLHATTDQLTATTRAAAQAQLKLDPATELNQRLARLTELASENHLQVDSIESGATTPFERYTTTSIRIGGRGGYRNCAAMLKEIRSSMADIGVTSRQMSSVGSGAVSIS